VVGWSSGAGLALALAAERPDLLNGAVVFEPQFHALRYLTIPLARTFVWMNVARLQRNPRRAVDVFYEFAFADRHGGNGWTDLPDTDKQRFYDNTSAILGAFAPHPFNALMEHISTRRIRDGGRTDRLHPRRGTAIRSSITSTRSWSVRFRLLAPSEYLVPRTCCRSKRPPPLQTRCSRPSDHPPARSTRRGTSSSPPG